MTNLGGWAIDQLCFDKIREILPSGRIIELGSGAGTDMLSKFYKVYSIEDNIKFVGLYNSTYIHAPLVGGWYDVEVLKAELPKSYDLILVDGPVATVNPFARFGFLRHIDLFNTDVPIILDDVNRGGERELAQLVAEYVGREAKIYGDKKKFAVI